MYEYIGKVYRVVDGDTIYVTVDLGFGIYTKLKLRLAGIDTPEIFRPRNELEKAHGFEAKEFVKEKVFDKIVKIKTKKTGKYGRWIATVTLIPDCEDLTLLLIEAGFEKKSEYLLN